MVPLVAVVIVLAGLATVALGRLGVAATARARAMAAADAAALAGAADGRAAAEALAAANGARVTAYEEAGADAEVTVALGAAKATARARREGGAGSAPAGPGADGLVAASGVGGLVTASGAGGAVPGAVGLSAASGAGGLAPAMRAAVARAAQLLGRPVPIGSGYRSPAAQAALWARRATNPYPVARPGTSMHERGLAIDVPLSFVPTLRRVAAQAGLCQPIPVTDPVHFEVCGARGG